MTATIAFAAPRPGPHPPSPLERHILVDIAAGLATTAHLWEGELPLDDVCRTGLCLIATPDYDAWLLRWPQRTSVTPHDHGESAGAFTVVSGELTEVRWHGGLRRTTRVDAGEVVTIPRGVVHDVVATGLAPAVSVHVYSPPLRSMGFYDDGGRSIIDRQWVKDSDHAIASARDVHPSGSALR